MTFGWWPLAVALISANVAIVAQPGELIERTLAIVGGQAITLIDVRRALALGLVESPATGDPVAAATERLIDRLLVLREVQRYAPPEPADAAVDERVRAVASRFDSADAYRAALEAGAFTEARLRAWVRDDLRIAAYLDQRFAAAGAPGDEDITAQFARRREEFEKTGTTFDAAAPKIREQLASARRAELIADWIADLRRRTPVVELIEELTGMTLRSVAFSRRGAKRGDRQQHLAGVEQGVAHHRRDHVAAPDDRSLPTTRRAAR